MALGILLAAVVVIICVLVNKISHKMGIPMLLGFIVLGMLFGTDGILKISFDNYDFSEKICSIALIFIMFYGGFGTSWGQAKPVAVKAGLLSTVGVALTAGITGLFCYFVLKISIMESFLIGAVLSSTDAASVFSILRSKKLGLKNNTDSMLEVESGSNDPSSYMLTVIMLSVMQGGITAGAIVKMVVFQLLFGALVGVGVAFAAGYILRHFRFATAGFDMAFIIGTALLSYSLAAVIGGNGYLSSYICGIILGNRAIQNKKALIHFFDGLTGLMQMLIFFLLGLLSTPSKIPAILLPALAIMLFLSLVARPASIFMLLSPFRCSVRQQLLVSFAGLRGAASIVFAIMASVGYPGLHTDVFHIVFCIVLLSISIQGSLLPPFAKWVKMSDENIDVMKTFSDYTEREDLQFIQVSIPAKHQWVGSTIEEITLPPDTLMIMVLRGEGYIIPDGKTTLLAHDIVVMSAYQYNESQSIYLQEEEISDGSKWVGQRICDYSPHPGELVVIMIRGGKTIIPEGDTVLQKQDTLVIASLPEM